MTNRLKQFTELIFLLQGVDVSKYDNTFLNKSIQTRIKETDCDSSEDYYRFLEQNQEETKILLESLHVNYSEFFRNSLTFSVLEHVILPSIVLKKGKERSKKIRVWTTACAAGQESYSLAMLLEELKNGSVQKIDYNIFATDLDKSQILSTKFVIQHRSIIINQMLYGK